MKKLDYAIVFVSEMKRSVEFYRDTLGLPLKFESPGWSEFSTGGTTLALHPADAINPTAGGEGIAPAGSCHPGFEVSDLDAFHKKMSSKGVKCIQAPKVMLDFGGKLAIYADPDGLPLSIYEPAKEE